MPLETPSKEEFEKAVKTYTDDQLINDIALWRLSRDFAPSTFNRTPGYSLYLQVLEAEVERRGLILSNPVYINRGDIICH